MEQIITCTGCPIGCRMMVRLSPAGRFKSVSGNFCQRGASYAEQECTVPMRIVTVVIPVDGRNIPLSVKTSKSIPKRMIGQVLEELAHIRVSPPVRHGDVIVENILGTGADIVSTRAV